MSKKILISIMTIILVVGICSISLAGCEDPIDYSIELTYDPSTDFGVYWYANGEYVRSSENMSLDAFDPSKPTFIFAHGWEPDENNTTNGVLEDLVTHKDTISKVGNIEVVNYAQELKDNGYNVACLGWFGYAKSLLTMFRYIWVDFEGGYPISVRFAQELASVMQDYQGEIKMVGHSYGAQLAVATSYMLAKFNEYNVIDNKNLVPTRLTLADPYISDTVFVTGWKDIKNMNIGYLQEPINQRLPKEIFADCISSIVKGYDSAVDIYGGMSGAYDKYECDGSDPAFEKMIECCTYVRSIGLKERYGDGNIHNITRDWVLLSIVDEVVLYDQNGDVAPSGGASDEQIKALRGKCYYQTYQGFDLSKDSMLLKDRFTEEF